MKKSVFFLLALAVVMLFASCQRQIPLVKNGQSEYQIVIPVHAQKSELKAASYLQRFIEQSSGFRIPIVRDRDEAREYEISIGNTDRVPESIAAQLPQIKNDGFLVANEGNKLFFLGKQDKAVVYAVSSFLEKFVGVEVLSSSVTVVPELKKIGYPADLNWLENPVFEFRTTHYRDTWDPFYADWHKLNHLPDGGHPDWGWWVHTFNTLVPPADYYTTHPEYFAEINGNRVPTQLCLTNPDVLAITVQNLRKAIDERPELTHWSVSQNDNVSYCQCEKCKALDEQHGGQMGSLLTFVNAVADTFPDRVISTLAYQYSRKPPVNLVPRENVNIMLCTIELSRSESIATSDDGASFRADLEGWGKLTEDILIWDYVIQFENLVSPFPNLHVLQPNLQYFRDNNATKHFQQGNREVGGEFAELRGFLISKLLWNPDANVDSLKDVFLNRYYGAAGPFIRKYIDRQEETLVASGSRLDIFGHPFHAINSYLTPELITQYDQWFDEAEKAVEDDQEILWRVQVARMPMLYAKIEIATRLGTADGGMYEKNAEGNWMVREDLKQMAEDLVALANHQGVTRFKEWHTTPDEYLAGLKKSWEVDMSPHLAMGKSVTLTEPASVKYAAGNQNLMVDGLRGPALTYAFNWLGFEGAECEATVDLESVQPVTNIASHWLQDVRSWIFSPFTITYAVSADGNQWTSLGTVDSGVDPNASGINSIEFALKLDQPVEARFVKMKTKSFVMCPDWHHGSGGPAWIFIDEFIVK